MNSDQEKELKFFLWELCRQIKLINPGLPEDWISKRIKDLNYIFKQPKKYANQQPREVGGRIAKFN